MIKMPDSSYFTYEHEQKKKNGSSMSVNSFLFSVKAQISV